MRFTDWPEQLARVIESARERGYSEDYYCAQFAADCVLAMTGEDHLSEFRGMTEEEAEQALGERSILDAVQEQLGKPEHPSRAHRGDVVVADRGAMILGICDGQFSWFLTQQGIVPWPTLQCRLAFRVR